MRISAKTRVYISIVVLWLFTVSGIIGILSEDYTDWFLGLTPLNLLITFIILLINCKPLDKKVLLAMSIPFVLGFITEALGVNYGLIFGNYTYGSNLGYKVLGVPIMICINWALLTAVTADVSRFFTKYILVASLIGGALMTGLDVLLEMSAPRFDFWEFQHGVIPLQNYIGWFITAFIAHLGYQAINIKTNTSVSIHILLSMALFFTVFIYF